MNALQMKEIEELEGQELSEERFQIKDQESLNWAFRKIAAFKAQMNETEEIAAKEIARVHQWAAEQQKPLEQSIEFFESLITQYHMQLLESDPKAPKTLKTPHGKSKSTRRKPAPVAVNKDKLLEHVKEAGMADYIKEEIRWGDFKKTLSITTADGKPVVVDAWGQRVEGVEIDQGGTTFKVEV
ncbi:host-nuclease inhibitor Gam family protein [Shouchella clausii]|uniref:host-nuclease inhibitor Gam family protein n=1 Tax=Shouchella clausii TaxID=79880 RepID=UPI0028972C56|nr:host-nuclease inhibitor Gam family protein [Shouchella clausii]